MLADDVLADDVLEKLFHRYAEQLFDELGHELASGVVKPDCRHAGPRPQVRRLSACQNRYKVQAALTQHRIRIIPVLDVTNQNA